MKTQVNLAATETSKIVYVRPVPREDLPQDVQDQIGDADTVYSVHNEDGAPLALVPNRNMAFALARQHDLAPVNVH